MSEKVGYPRMGVAVFLINEKTNKILLAKRINNSHENGKYGLPGGKIDFGEEPADAAIREIKEETGLVVDYCYIRKLPIITSNVYPEEGNHFLCLWFCTYVDVDNIDYIEKDENGNYKTEKWEWHDPSNLPKPLMLCLIDALGNLFAESEHIDFSEDALRDTLYAHYEVSGGLTIVHNGRKMHFMNRMLDEHNKKLEGK
jgi:mutator protein MutT